MVWLASEMAPGGGKNTPFVMAKWQITKERSVEKDESKRVDLWYVAPEPYKYGFSTFLSELPAIQFRDEMNRKDAEPKVQAGVAESVDAQDLKSGGQGRGGSSPPARTTPELVFVVHKDGQVWVFTEHADALR